jgi:hypothetical protein
VSLTGVVVNTFSSRSEDSTGGLSSSLPPCYCAVTLCTKANKELLSLAKSCKKLPTMSPTIDTTIQSISVAHALHLYYLISHLTYCPTPPPSSPPIGRSTGQVMGLSVVTCQWTVPVLVDNNVCLSPVSAYSLHPPLSLASRDRPFFNLRSRGSSQVVKIFGFLCNLNVFYLQYKEPISNFA